jgi:hypothetical protein
MHTDYGEIGRPPMAELSLIASAVELGNAVLQSLGSVSGQVVPIDLAQAMAAFRAHLKDLGFKNTAAFERNAAVVGVVFDCESYKVVSHEKDEKDVNLPTASKTLPAAATAEELGNTSLAAFRSP